MSQWAEETIHKLRDESFVMIKDREEESAERSGNCDAMADESLYRGTLRRRMRKAG